MDTGLICQPGVRGEICISTPYLMAGYLKRPEDIKECLLEDGFYRTGDLGYYNERGDFLLVDRIKELIKYV